MDGAIHRHGGPEILAACRRLRAEAYPDRLPTGQAVATTAGLLPAAWVILTVGPVYSRHEDRSALLASCYTGSLRIAAEVGAHTVAFPAVSAGIYGWPPDDDAASLSPPSTPPSIPRSPGPVSSCLPPTSTSTSSTPSPASPARRPVIEAAVTV